MHRVGTRRQALQIKVLEVVPLASHHAPLQIVKPYLRGRYIGRELQVQLVLGVIVSPMISHEICGYTFTMMTDNKANKAILIFSMLFLD